MKRALLVIAGAAALAACGKVGDLKPAPGQTLPVKPKLASSTPSADDLLTPPPYARPQRVDELVRRSEPRASDPFDLPPPSGGAAPAPPTDDQAEASTDQPGPSAPQ